MVKFEQKVRQYVETLLAGQPIELVDVEYEKEGGNWFLRVYIDKEGGIGIDDCEGLSKALDPYLDEECAVTTPYTLEVSSPGLDRPLKKESDFIRYNGKKVDVKLYKPKDGRKKFCGKLSGFEDGFVTVINEEDEQALIFERKEIGSIRLSVDF